LPLPYHALWADCIFAPIPAAAFGEALDESLSTRRGLKWTAAALCVFLVVLAALAAALLLLDANHFRGALVRYLAARAGREIRIDGALHLHLLSLSPSAIAENVSIGNPPWTAPGRTAEIGRIAVVFDLPNARHPLAIQRLELSGARLHLLRESRGAANWQWSDPGLNAGKAPPIIHSLSMPDAHVDYVDARRHLQFDGTVSAGDARAAPQPAPLRIEGAGQLNGRAATFTIDADPLAAADHLKPYRFDFDERSAGSRLSGHGLLPHPFDFSVLDAKFEAVGADLKDLYFLTGVSLPNTGEFQLQGELARRADRFIFSKLLLKSGQSDMHGTVSIEPNDGRRQVQAELSSQHLRLSDLGARAAGGAPEAGTALLPDTPLPVDAVRRADAVVNFDAQLLEVGRVALRAVAATVRIDHGLLTLAPMSAQLFGGKLTGRVKIDATRDVPYSEADLRVADLQLAQIDGKAHGQPPVEGPVRVRLSLTGRGRSMHAFASHANGTMTAAVPHGLIRASLAELAGIDLRGLGLIIARKNADSAVRCAVASFHVDDGTMAAQMLVVDTDPVLITGVGAVDLDSEAIDLKLRGRPKNLRLLRLRSPLLIGGTLRHPSIGVGSAASVAQTGAAVVLGVMLTPLAAALAFVDPGLAQDADCAGLMTQAKSEERPIGPTRSAASNH
jgi:AsmA family protein